jgi:hypothetical protein
MNSVLYGLDSPTLSADNIKSMLNERLDLLEDHVRSEMETDVSEILDAVSDETFVTTPLYKIMAMLPDVYMIDVSEQNQLLVKLGKTIDNLQLLNEVI